MNLRTFLILLAIGLFLVCACVVITASAVATDEQIRTYARYDPNITYSMNCTPSMNVTTVNPNDQVLMGSCVDLRIVEGWYGRLVHQSGLPVIDVSSYTRTIMIGSDIWKTGDYYQWAPYEEPNANLYMFTVISEQERVVEVKNVTSLNVTQVVLPTPFRYNLEEKPVSDVLVARGDPLSFNTSRITNLTRAWLFGVEDGLYDIPCENGQLFVNESMILSLRPSMYYLLLDNPGTNTLTEAVWNEEKERVESPLRSTPYLEVPGYDPRTVYDKIVPWLKAHSDDVIEVYKVEIQEPYVEITGIGTAYSNMTDVLQVEGYTNLAINTSIYAVLDEDNRSMEYIHVPRTYDWVRGLPEKPGTMREFRIYPPIDYVNKTIGQHHVMVHSSFGAYAVVPYWIYSLPEGQEKPAEILKYVGGNEFVPTPTPVTVTVEVTKTVIQYQTVIQVQTVDYNKLASEQVNQSVPLIASYIGWGLLLGVPLLWMLWVALRAVYQMVRKK